VSCVFRDAKLRCNAMDIVFIVLTLMSSMVAFFATQLSPIIFLWNTLADHLCPGGALSFDYLGSLRLMCIMICIDYLWHLIPRLDEPLVLVSEENLPY